MSDIWEDIYSTEEEMRLAAEASGEMRHKTTASELLEIIVLNAAIGPDAKMDGFTDCYHVPLDDIDRAKEWLKAKEVGDDA